MLTKITPVARAISQGFRLQALRCMSSHTPAHFKTSREIVQEHHSDMDAMPVPSGSWQEYHGKRNARWNMYLIVSSLLFAATGYVLYVNDVLYLHGPPDLKKVDMTRRS
ncbi:hypothetical protein ScPMuIL_010518 [Solemya velum]